MKTKLILTLPALALLAVAACASQPTKQSEYHVISTTKVGGDGGFDYVYADPVARKIYIPRTGQGARVTVFDMDTLASAGEFPSVAARGAAVDAKSGHGFCSSKPVVMWDTKTLSQIKTIDVDGRPDGIMEDPFNQHVYVFSHSAPNVTVIDANDGKVLGTIDLGGAPEQAASDGAGHVYVDLEDKDQVAVVDANTMQVTAKYGLDGKGGGPGGLAMDAVNHILFVACHDPQTMVILDANTGKVLTTLPIGRGVDGAGFNPNTMEAFASQGDGTLTIIKENSPTDFVVEQTLKTMPGAKTMTIDTKTGDIYLIAAEYGPAPVAAAGERQRRGPMVAGSFSIIRVGK
jgi:YVTN family beta-propeller protein